jgi:hypothetical protein
VKYYAFAIGVTVAIAFAIGIPFGFAALGTLVLLAILEVTFSFDNAVVNATVLRRMNEYWQTMFLVVGLLVAVGFMRLVFPILVVALTAHLGFGKVVDLALNHSHEYGAKLANAHGAIAVFGGVFLMMIFLDYMLEEREYTWLGPIERFLAKIGKLDRVSTYLGITVVFFIVVYSPGKNQLSLAIAGLGSLALYGLVNMLSSIFEEEDEEAADEETATALATNQTAVKSPNSPGAKGLAAFFLFLYLEAQDSAFSFDGVSGAFAISDNVKYIAAGLAIGAVFVRSMTIHLLRTGTLAKLPYLEHGAHWAIGTLAACLLITTHVKIPEAVTGLIGVFFIGAAVIYSLYDNKKKGISSVDTVENVVPLRQSA